MDKDFEQKQNNIEASEPPKHLFFCLFVSSCFRVYGKVIERLKKRDDRWEFVQNSWSCELLS